MPDSDPFEEVAAEMGCEPDEIEGTFPPEFIQLIRARQETHDNP